MQSLGYSLNPHNRKTGRAVSCHKLSKGGHALSGPVCNSTTMTQAGAKVLKPLGFSYVLTEPLKETPGPGDTARLPHIWGAVPVYNIYKAIFAVYVKI